MKRVLFKSLLAVACLLSSTSVSAYDFEVDGIYYNVVSLPNLTAEIAGAETAKTSVTFSIPSEVTYMGRTFSIIKIGSRTFDGCSGLTSVTIPNSVTSIGVSTFGGCI